MNVLRVFAAALAFVALVPTLAAADSDKIADPALGSSLDTIERTASQIADGKLGTGERLLGPARTIALAWERAAAILSKGYAYIVEVKEATRPIAAFEADWKTAKDPRPQANEIVGAVADLYGLTTGSVPPDAHRLGYLERKIAFAVEHKQWSDAKDAVGDLQSAWSSVKPEVEKRPHGADAASRFERASSDEVGAIERRDANAASAAGPRVAAAVRSVDSAF